MRKIVGILILLVAVGTFATILNPAFASGFNIENLLRRSSLFGIISLGASLVIIAGGIDLAIGSIVCLVGTLLPWLAFEAMVPMFAAMLLLFLVVMGLGAAHGALVTRVRLQPFVVTLCGLLLYRGIARGITDDQPQGFGSGYSSLRWLATGRIPLPGIESFAIPVPFLILLILALILWILLSRTVWGRHLYAIGSNSQAALYSGVDVPRTLTSAYIGCALLSGLGGLLFLLDLNSAAASSFGNFYELYAIAAAVLGGCSLRGGSGTVLGVIIGAALLQVLSNTVTILGVPSKLEFAVIGAVLLIGVTLDELVKYIPARRQE